MEVPKAQSVSVTKCGGCWGYYPEVDKHKVPCEGCKDHYFTCKKGDVKDHQLLYCGRHVYFYTTDDPMSFFAFWHFRLIGICGAPYRNCDEDADKKKTHEYTAILSKNSSDYSAYKGRYLSGYNVLIPTPCGMNSTKEPPAVSIHGSNSEGSPEKEIDQSSGCDSCICGSRTCPDAASNHPKETPGPVSFNLSRGVLRGSIEISWYKPDFDGFSEITDYEYKIKYRGSDGKYHLWHDWKSTGSGPYTKNAYFKMVTGFTSNTRLQVSMRAKNAEGESSTVYYKYVNTKD